MRHHHGLRSLLAASRLAIGLCIVLLVLASSSPARADGLNPYSITITPVAENTALHIDFSNAPYGDETINVVYIDWDYPGQPNTYEAGIDFNGYWEPDAWIFRTNSGLPTGTYYVTITVFDHVEGWDYWIYEFVVP